MMPALKAEFRKIYSIRSTYVISGFCLALVVFFAFYIEGIKSVGPFTNPNLLASEVTSAVNAIAGIAAIVGVLLMTHEYRYNTIMYTLTSSRSRTQVLLAKFIAISIYAIILTLLVSILSPSLTALGLHLRHINLVHQVLSPGELLWRSLFTGWGYAMLTFLLAALLRNQVAAIVAVFIGPVTVEPLLGLLLKEKVVYLPFTALRAVLDKGTITFVHAAIVVLVWIVTGWLIAWQLFLRRDAN